MEAPGREVSPALRGDEAGDHPQPLEVGGLDGDLSSERIPDDPGPRGKWIPRGQIVEVEDIPPDLPYLRQDTNPREPETCPKADLLARGVGLGALHPDPPPSLASEAKRLTHEQGHGTLRGGGERDPPPQLPAARLFDQGGVSDDLSS